MSPLSKTRDNRDQGTPIEISLYPEGSPSNISHLGDREYHNFAQLLQERAKETPNALAYRFVDDNEMECVITYGELDTKARSVAAKICSVQGAIPKPVLLLFTPGFDYLAGLFGCFYAGVPAVPAFPPDLTKLTRTLPRLAALLEDADTDLALTTSNFAPLLRDWIATVCPKAHVIATDLLRNGGENIVAPSEPESLALLQYTSGSTSKPRGVMLNHAHLMHNCREISRGFGIHAGSSGALWLPPYHDMGLIGGILTPMVSKIPCSLMSPMTFLRQPMAWLRMVSRHRATIIGGPNFAFDLCVRRSKDEDLKNLDLSSVELTFTAAEPVRAETMHRFIARFGPFGFRGASFYPCYGLAEATLFVTGCQKLGGWRSLSLARDSLELEGIAKPAGPADLAQVLVSCGFPGPETRLIIVDPATGEQLPDGSVGEIWVHSPSVASGYWRRLEESTATFGATNAGMSYLRTGDLGFVQKGELFVTGRLKDLLIINGRNYHPMDIECACETSVSGIRASCGAAFAVEDESGSSERLVLVYEAELGTEVQYQSVIDQIRRAISLELNLSVFAIVLIKPRTLPKTSSGKVQRWLARRYFLAGKLEALARWQMPTLTSRKLESTPVPNEAVTNPSN